MGDAIARRGPDSDGYWADAQSGVGFAHRRLAIVDLSIEGAQPMRSPSGRYVLNYNGEIYNHALLRQRLAGPWRGTSDTETLLAGFDAWGIRKTLEAAVGMFALAVWDAHEQVLTLARDRFGEKPLYYGWQQNAPGSATFLFGSELSALRAHPDFAPQIDRGALRSFMRYNNVSGTASIYQGIHKLPPGTLLHVRAGDQTATPESYWSAAHVAEHAHRHPFTGEATAAIDELEALLGDAIAQQMIADVPVGAFLSGGVDSSTIVALMQKRGSQPVRSYTIGFDDPSLNEAPLASAVAKHLGTRHTELYVSPADALALIPDLASIYAEPFADSSQIPTYLLSKLTRQHVTVALSGDCGDELFGGYNRYAAVAKVQERFAGLPPALRRGLANVLMAIPSAVWDLRGGLRGDKVQKVARLLRSRSADEAYLSLISHWEDPAEVVIGGVEPPPLVASRIPEIAGFDPVSQMMLLDVMGYMTDDILTKVDRAAMAVSLETRVPMLDHRVAEFAWRLPLSFKLRDGQSKWILRQILYRHVPRELIDRPKTGFAVPIGDWLRGPLRDWAEDLLSESALRQAGYLHAQPIRQRWQEHLSGRRNWYAQLWNVLMFQSWLKHSNVR
jgi:asparagine synthase (glutamine-hydrolysing)